MNCFVVAGVPATPVSQVFRGIWPFVVTEIVVLALLVFFPQLSVWLPGLVYK